MGTPTANNDSIIVDQTPPTLDDPATGIGKQLCAGYFNTTIPYIGSVVTDDAAGINTGTCRYYINGGGPNVASYILS